MKILLSNSRVLHLIYIHIVTTFFIGSKKFLTCEHTDIKILDMCEHTDIKILDMCEHTDTKILDMCEHTDTKILDMCEHTDTKILDIFSDKYSDKS